MVFANAKTGVYTDITRLWPGFSPVLTYAKEYSSICIINQSGAGVRTDFTFQLLYPKDIWDQLIDSIE